MHWTNGPAYLAITSIENKKLDNAMEGLYLKQNYYADLTIISSLRGIKNTNILAKKSQSHQD